MLILVGCAQTAAVLDDSMVGGMGDRWDFVIGWLHGTTKNVKRTRPTNPHAQDLVVLQKIVKQ